jgi:hypothetical protein
MFSVMGRMLERSNNKVFFSIVIYTKSQNFLIIYGFYSLSIRGNIPRYAFWQLSALILLFPTILFVFRRRRQKSKFSGQFTLTACGEVKC